MRNSLQAVSLFYSSTNDTGAAARKATVEKVCKLVETSQDVLVRIIYWDDNIPGGVSGKTGQDRIDKEVAGAFDVYFGCMGVNFGKGTVREFSNAIESHIRDRSPKEVLFAFDETPVNPFKVPENFKQVKDFRKSLESKAKFGKSILYFCYSSPEDFETKLFRDLTAAIKKATSRIAGGMPRLR